ncbi:hypothetical protein GGS23DRAFT_320106 [Durotheca rogersii]|uniref:uncharacterized protein n=1 Tax=Durotheca rogersii TaxID=419775 RepID=UPI002220F27E|nr:uncharacterized protein GGS23DRAFT_320106 [Durotheca rogersii]KAI5859496.1 hypothetical protein GGS23DRAFT_320106 [Durotheca rogersii]
MSVQSPVTTRKAAPGPARKKKDYDIVQQGIKELYPLDKPNIEPEIDIVFVPGLGAHPEDSWKSENTSFNWTTEGLVRDFPRARILLYMYESAWTGSLKVKQFMANIAMTLLNGLRSKREGRAQRRPIVFIGHSMGGLVIAKAITIADSRRDRFPIMFEAIAAAIFFGTPFNGAPVASAAAMYAHLAEKVGAASSSKLLDLMKPGDESLRELKHEFMRLAGKVSPRIELFCFFEEQPTDFSKIAGLPNLFGLSKALIPKEYAEFVSRDSATLPGVEEQGLACNHRNLVKFDGPKDDRWNQFVRDQLKEFIHRAPLTVKNRLNSVRAIDRSMINSIMEALDSVQVQKKRKALAQTFASSSWITKEAEYTQWLGEPETSDEVRTGDCLWIRGPEGRGKTSASLAAVNEIETLIRTQEEKNTSQGPILLAYFFCDSATDYSTAEDILKSLITQLINKQETLASYAKSFAKKNESDRSQARVTVENLWQTLQDMLADEFIGSKIIFVLNNLHVLPEDSDSTIKLLNYLQFELQSLNTADTKRVPTRWMITSRAAHNIEEALKVDGVRLVDLDDDEKYGNQVQMALRKRAKERVTTLEKEKNYNKALAYFASSLIGKRAQNTQWIDITCVQLQELPHAESDLKVRRVLERMPQDLTTLLNNSWLQVFKANEADAEKIKEMLRALVLTYEDPTEVELGILAGFRSNDDEKAELRRFIEKCKPLLIFKRASNTISFMNVVVKTHLLENAKQLLGMSAEEKKWQHGVLALRSFSHVNDRFNFPPLEKAIGEFEDLATPEQGGQDENEDEAASMISDEDGGDDDDEDEDDEDDYDDESETDVDSEEEQDPEADILRDRAEAYTVKYWLRHASKATREIAEDLSQEEDFWGPESLIRHRWLVEYFRMTSVFDGFSTKSFTGLHVAASVGFRELVAALIRNGYENQIMMHDEMVNSPLHFAAYFGRPKIVEELLDRGAVIDDGDEIQEQTPLHMAAFGGHVEVMKKLLLRGANANATSNDIGPVVNAAITSGNRAAVELLVEHGVSLTIDREDLTAPLALSALLSDISMFEYLVEKYAAILPPEEYSKALVKAAEAGRVDVFKRLLDFEHAEEYFQDALDTAGSEWNWDIVVIILEKRAGLNCDEVFYEAATGTEDQDSLLEVIWRYADGSISKEKLDESLYEATDTEKESTVKLLLQKFGANANATGLEYGNALTAAAYDGTIDIVRLLLEAGADVNAAEGWALQTAATEGHYEVVLELLEHGVDVNAIVDDENFEAGTALQGACEAGRTHIVSLLLDRGADPNLGGGPDAPPVVAATIRAEEEILEFLVKAKADLDVLGGQGNPSTPLINAAAYMPQSSLQLLLDAGADINLPDGDGDTALIVAASRGDKKAVEFLLDSGADIMHANKEGKNALQAALKKGNSKCLEVLVDRVSVLLGTLKTAMESGDTTVTSIVRGVFNGHQALNYDDETPVTPKATASHTTTPPVKAIDRQSNSDSDRITPSIYGQDGRLDSSDDGLNPNGPHSIEQISDVLKSAIANQAALWNEFTNKPFSTISAVPERLSYDSQPNDNLEQAPGRPEPEEQKRVHGPDSEISAPQLVELPPQGVVKRKPAPRVSYESQPAPSQPPSPKPLEPFLGSFPVPPASVVAYLPEKEVSPFQNDQPGPERQHRTSGSSASYQNTHTHPQSQTPPLTASQQGTAQYHNGGPPYGSSYYQPSATAPASGGQYAPHQPTYAAYNPNPASQVPPRPPKQQFYNPASSAYAHQGQAYQPQDWQGGGGPPSGSGDSSIPPQPQYQAYNAGVAAPDQQPQPQYANGGVYDGSGWDPQRPQLRAQRSSFFSGGVRTTLDKAKTMGTGMFGRK